MTFLLLWLFPGQTPPKGYVWTGVVSRWPDTGEVRSRLYERQLP